MLSSSAPDANASGASPDAPSDGADDASVLAAWARAFPGPAGALAVPVTLCGLPETIILPPAAQAALYLPLCRRLARATAAAAAADATAPAQPRLLVGVSGPAGSGKTCLAAVLTALLNAAPAALPCAAMLSMDAYHMPNAWLAERGLAAFKGRHDTYHTAALAADLALLRAPHATPPQPPADAPPPLPERASWASAAPAAGGGLEVLLPVYDRGGTHDPRLGGARIGPAVRVVLVEGLFVARAAGPWGAVRAQLAEVIALRAPLALCRARALHRRLRSILIKQGGSAAGGAAALGAALDAGVLAQLQAAQAHYARADAPTYREVAADEAGASVVVAHELAGGAVAALGGEGEGALALPAVEAIAALQRLGAGSGGGGLGEVVAVRGLA
jgi:pantothenate kinase